MPCPAPVDNPNEPVENEPSPVVVPVPTPVVVPKDGIRPVELLPKGDVGENAVDPNPPDDGVYMDARNGFAPTAEPVA